MQRHSIDKTQASAGTRRPPRRSRAIGELIRAGAVLYARERHLPWLARTTPQELYSEDEAVARVIVARLAKALRSERRRGRAGHWSYDLSRHITLAQALVAERRRLRQLASENGWEMRTRRETAAGGESS